MRTTSAGSTQFSAVHESSVPSACYHCYSRQVLRLSWLEAVGAEGCEGCEGFGGTGTGPHRCSVLTFASRVQGFTVLSLEKVRLGTNLEPYVATGKTATPHVHKCRKMSD